MVRVFSSWLASAVLAAIAMPPLASAAPAPATPVAVAAPLTNSVRCIQEALTADEREIVLILMLQDLGSGTTNGQAMAYRQEIDRLLEDAHGRCLARFKWLAGQSANAKEFALAALMGEVMGQMLRFGKNDTRVIDAWFETNRARLSQSLSMSGNDRTELRKVLTAAGWDGRSGDPVRGGLIYASILVDQLRYTANFARNRYYP